MAAPLITTRFTASSTADDVLSGVDLTGVPAVVTGASSGPGRETARALAAAGAEVTPAVRDSAAGRAVADAITGSSGVEVRRPDLADRRSVAAFVTAWRGR